MTRTGPGQPTISISISQAIAQARLSRTFFAAELQIRELFIIIARLNYCAPKLFMSRRSQLFLSLAG